MGNALDLGSSNCCGVCVRENVVKPSTTDMHDDGLTLFRAGAPHAASGSDRLHDFGFDPFRVDCTHMCSCYTQMIDRLGLREAFALTTAVVSAFVSESSAQYRTVPYHNFTHAFSVAQFLYALCVRVPQVSKLLVSTDTLTMMVAAIVHDANHPGNNNGWEVANNTALALRYNNESVLENYHAAIGLEIMGVPGRDMFGTLSTEQAKRSRDMFVKAILLTDMAQHGKMVERLKGQVAQPQFSRTQLPENSDELVGLLLHSADISNPLVPNFDVCRTWAERITEEFVNQYNKEIRANLKPTQMWANLHTPVGFYKSQVGFIDFIVAPLWNTMFCAFPDLQELAGLRDSMSSNRERWAKLTRDEEERQGQ